LRYPDTASIHEVRPATDEPARLRIGWCPSSTRRHLAADRGDTFVALARWSGDASAHVL